MIADALEPRRLARVRQLQREVFDLLVATSLTLQDGETEHQVTRRIHKALCQRGVRSYFHGPVALFGERTAYPGDFGTFAALPTERRLRPEDAVILDAAPVVDGHVIDVSYAVPRPGVRAEFEAGDRVLRDLRRLILERTLAGDTMRTIARTVDTVIKDHGLANCHRKHIGMVLGHRVVCETRPWLARRSVFGLSPAPVVWFLWRSLRSRKGRPELSPNWNHTRRSDAPAPPGLWAIEPHVGHGAVGLKFEEMLVVTADTAFYLDDALPHHQRWQASFDREAGA